jgi:hypothetical protein
MSTAQSITVYIYTIRTENGVYDQQPSEALSPNIIKIKLRKMGWAGHVVPMGGKRNACKLLVRKPEEDHWED